MSTWHRVQGALRGQRVLEVYTDGSAEERVGKPGGWAFVVVRSEEVLLTSNGGAKSTTSLVMELEAALAGLRAVVTRGWHLVNEVELISDSSIALDIAGGRFMPRKHVELATSLRETAREARATTRWVRAHSGHRWNEVVDVLAHEAKRRLGSSPHPDPLPHGERESR